MYNVKIQIFIYIAAIKKIWSTRNWYYIIYMMTLCHHLFFIDLHFTIVNICDARKSRHDLDMTWAGFLWNICTCIIMRVYGYASIYSLKAYFRANGASLKARTPPNEISITRIHALSYTNATIQNSTYVRIYGVYESRHNVAKEISIDTFAIAYTCKIPIQIYNSN